MSFLGAALSGVAGIVGGILGQRAQEEAQDRAYSYNERMANTTFQRSVADMKEAGLNPMLAYNVQSPTGAGGSTDYYDSAPVVNNAFSSAMNAIALKKDLEIKNTQDDKMKSEISLTKATEEEKREQAKYMRAMVIGQERENSIKLNQVESSAYDSKIKKAQVDLLMKQIDKAIEDGKYAKAQAMLAEYNTQFVTQHPVLSALGANPVKGSFGDTLVNAGNAMLPRITATAKYANGSTYSETRRW